MFVLVVTHTIVIGPFQPWHQYVPDRIECKDSQLNVYRVSLLCGVGPRAILYPKGIAFYAWLWRFFLMHGCFHSYSFSLNFSFLIHLTSSSSSNPVIHLHLTSTLHTQSTLKYYPSYFYFIYFSFPVCVLIATKKKKLIPTIPRSLFLTHLLYYRFLYLNLNM